MNFAIRKSHQFRAVCAANKRIFVFGSKLASIRIGFGGLLETSPRYGGASPHFYLRAPTFFLPFVILHATTSAQVYEHKAHDDDDYYASVTRRACGGRQDARKSTRRGRACTLSRSIIIITFGAANDDDGGGGSVAPYSAIGAQKSNPK